MTHPAPTASQEAPLPNPPDVHSLSELIARVEGATGPDRELDALVEIAARNEEARRTGLEPKHWAKWVVSRDFWVEDPHTAYEPASHTRSVDSALALIERVLPGWSWSVRRSGFGDPADAELWNPRLQPSQYNSFQATNKFGSPALALILALLKALEATHA